MSFAILQPTLMISSWRLRVAYTTSELRCDTQAESELYDSFIPDNVYCTQINDPNIGETCSNEPARETLRIGKMRFVQREAATFLVRKKGFDAESFGIKVTGHLGCIHIRDQIHGLFAPFTPTTEKQNGTILLTA